MSAFIHTGRSIITESLRQRLQELSRRDPTFAVFGASSHLYRSKPVSASAIAQFESEHRVTLPPDYAEFLQVIGKGAGPYYGLFSPQDSLTEIRYLEPFKTLNPANPALPFPIHTSHLQEIEVQALAGKMPAVTVQKWPCNGCLPISFHGCTFWSVVVLNGDFAGRVWDVANFTGDIGEWQPARRPSGLLSERSLLKPLARPPTFTEWFVGWLEQCEADLSAAEAAAKPQTHSLTSPSADASSEPTQKPSWLETLFKGSGWYKRYVAPSEVTECLPIDNSLRYVLYGLSVVLNVDLRASEIERLFADRSHGDASKRSYEFHRSPFARVTGLVEAYESESVWLSVSASVVDKKLLLRLIERAEHTSFGMAAGDRTV